MNTSPSLKTADTARSTLIVVFLAETAFFGTLLMAYLYMRTGPSEVMFKPIAAWDRLFAGINTAVLLLSAWTTHQSSVDIQQGRKDRLTTNLLISVALGILFIFGQLFEFSHAHMAVNDAFFGGIFFALMGFHALHVVAGILILALNYRRARLGDFTASHYVAVQVGTWFWYYVTVIWCVLFVALYLV
ncbi:MAG: cytochrome c oxidase subunit 3 [Chloroflexota bacterium]